MIQKSIWDSIEETQTIFREKDVFTIEYVPETVNYRKPQIDKILYNLKDRLSHDKRPYHMILNGSYATGKTLTIKYIFKEAEKEFKNVKCVHINCKSNKTAYLIYLNIYRKLFEKERSVGGLSTSALLDLIMKKLVKDNIILLIALDDVTSVKDNRDMNDVLYNLLRNHENSDKAKISVFTIKNNKHVLTLDNDVETVFSAIDVEFPKYSYDEIHNIIAERCRIGLYNGALSDKLISHISRFCYNRGDLRKCFDRIYKAGLNAEFDGSHKILKPHFN